MNKIVRTNGRRTAGVAIADKIANRKKAVNNDTITNFTVSAIEKSFSKSTFAAAGKLAWDHSKLMPVGPTTNANTNHVMLSITPGVGKLALMKGLKIKANEMGNAKYVGLSAEEATTLSKENPRYMSDGVRVLITKLRAEQINGLIEEMRDADLNDPENIAKIFSDINVIYRLYQEKIIDAAKKLYDVIIEILLDSYRAKSLQKWMHTFDYTKRELVIDQKEFSKEGVELFEDPIYEIQRDLVEYIKQNTEAVFALEIEMSTEEQQRLLSYQGHGPVADLKSVVKGAYAALTSQHTTIVNQLKALSFGDEEPVELLAIENKRYNYALSKLKNLALQLLDGYSDEDAASIMQLLSCLDKKNNFNKRSGNQIATSLLPEKYLTMILNTQAEVKVSGYKLAVDMGLNVGDEVEFLNGVSDNGSILDFKNEIEYATGTFRIEIFNGAKYAVKDLEFNSPEANYNKRFFVVKNKSYKEINSLLDALQEGESILVDDMGVVKSRGIKVAEIRGEFNGVCGDLGNTIETLVNVRGTVSYVNIVEGDGKYDDTIMFELSDIVELEEESDIEIEDDLAGEGSTTFEVEGDDLEINDDLGINDDLDSNDWDEEDIDTEEDWEDGFNDDLDM